MKRLNSIAAFLFLVLASAPIYAVDLDRKVVSSITSAEMDAAETAALAEALGLQVGKPLDADQLDAAVSALGTSGKWMRVFVDGALENGQLHLYLRGTRVRKLRKMEYTNVDEEILEEVKRKIRQDSDQTADIESFATLRQALKDAYQERGYYFADVQFATRILNAEEADVEVRVQANAPTKVGRLQVRGGPDEENAAMADLVPLQRGMIFSRIKLAEGVEKINNYLRANQYPTSRVADSTFVFSKDSLEVDVTILVKMGERFQIRFSGNTVFNEVQLKALVTDDVLAHTDPSLRIAALIEQKYHAVGYPDCSVEVKKTLVEGGKLNLMELRIREGERAMIDSLRFSSGETVNGIDLEEMFYAVAPGVLERRLYWADGISQAVVSMQSRLQTMGYLNCRISEPKVTFSDDRRRVILFFDADLGVQTILSKVEFAGVQNFGYPDLEKEFSFKVGKPLNRDQVAETGGKILNFLANSGFPDAKFVRPPESSIELSRDQQSAIVRYELEEGTRYRIGSIQIEGLRKTKSKVILREMDITTGATYNARKIRQAEENINLLGLFSRAEILETPSMTPPGEMNLRVVVRETPPGVGEMGLGGVYEEPRLRIRPFVGLAYRNVSGLNQTASVRGDLGLPISRLNNYLQIPFIEYSTILGYRYPWVAGLPITFASQFGLDRVEVVPAEQTILTRARIEGRLEKRFSNKVTAIYRLIRVERTTTESFLPIAPNTNAPITESIGSTGPGLILDLRDDIFNPRRGSFHSLDVELAHPILFSQQNIAFILAIMRNSFYFPIMDSVGLAVSLGLGYAHSLVNEPIARARLVNELALGGQGSIRGIAPRRLAPDETARDMAYYNARMELSTTLFADFGIAVFFDSGQIFPDFRPVARADGVGIGLRYKTPVGPVVIDFAQGLGELKEAVKFYFTVGTI